jgi:PAS domain S-box-containing protein
MKIRRLPQSRGSSLSPGRIALGYAMLAMLWIAFSDEAVTRLNLPPAVNTIKGTVFVFVTAALLYFSIRRLVQVIQRTAQERDETAAALRRLNRELRAISDCNQVLLRATDEQSLLKEICRIICEEAGYRVAWVGYAEHDVAKTVRPVAWTGAERETLANLGVTWADTDRGRGPCGTAIRTGKTSCLEDYVADPRGAPWLASAAQHGFRSGIAVPLKDEHAKTFGSLNIYSTQPNAFTADEIRLLEELAGDMAFGIAALRSQTARQQAEQQLALLSFALDKGYEAAFLMDEARLRYVNEEACRRLGYSREELLNKSVSDIDPDFPAERWPDHWRELKAQQSLTFESRHRTRDGRIFPVEVSANYFEYGGRAYNLALVRDITERKRAEEERRESAERFRAIADYTYDWENWIGVDGKLLWVNPAVERITGYSVAECLAMPDFPLPIVAETDRESLAQQMREAVDGSSRNDFEFRVRHKDGRLVWVAASWQPIYDSRGPRLGHRSSMRDITERKRAEEEVRRSEAYLAETQRLTHTGTAVADPTGVPLYYSEELFRILRFDPQQGLPTVDQAMQRIHPEDRVKFVQAFQGAIDDRTDVDIEYRLLLPDGTVKHMHGIGHPIFNAGGELVEIVVTTVDITERKRAEDELRRSEACLAEGQRLSRTGSWAWSPVTLQPLYWSEEMFRIYGLDPQDGLPTAETFWQRIHPEDRDRFRELQMHVAQRSLDYEHDHRIVLPDGTVKHIHAVGHPVRDEAGKLVEYIGTAMDVTERKRAEEALRRSEAYLAEGQRLAHMGSWAWNPATLENLYWSEEMFRIFDINPQNGLPTAETFWQRVHPEDLDHVRELFMKVAQRSMEYEHDHRIVLPDGTVKHIHAVGHPVLDEHGKVVQCVGTAMDVTERKRAEDELRKHREHLEDLVKQRTEQLAEAKTRAEAANRAKSTFLANMSHELRTPLNAVLGFSRLLKNDPDVTPPQQETLDVIVRSGEHLLNLINNVLDLAKIESGQVALKESEVDLPRLLHEMQSLMGAGAVEKGLRFTLEHDPDLPRYVAVDAGRLRQVLLNLLGNAIKYTESGSVKLRARLASLHGSEKAELRFEVTDSGPGISPEDYQRIFAPFVQLGDQAPAQAGTGLGLAICKQYVEMMGGQIGVTSQPGKGSVFYFEIPVTILSAVAERDELKHRRILGLAEGQPRHRLLIVEDQPENRLLLRRLLSPLGFELREAVNGQEAVALFDQWHPDLIWMDIRMPVMDGLEAVRRIRATPAGTGVRIIALTAHALEEEREPIMAAGCDDLVRKPFHEHELFGALARHLRLKFIYETAPLQENTQEAPGLTLNPEQLDALPSQLLQELRQAVIELDTARTQILIEQVAERDASLGRALKTLATRLDYKRLLKLLEKEHPETGETL